MATYTNQRAEALKAEGNALFQAGKWRPAYRKYSDAIKEDPKNAVYYANRAACSLSLKEFMDASSDATKATELDPKYAKAWSRLATARCALAKWTSSIEAWNKALQCLPQGGQLSEVDKRMKIQFEEGLAKVKKEEAKIVQPQMRAFKATDKLPWNCAEENIEQLQAEKIQSSGFVIYHAYQEFMKGVTTMKGLHQKPMNGQMAWIGKPDALVDMSNGLMRDNRVFHFDSSDWIQKYNTQVMFECQFFDAWKDAGPKTVIEEAPKRVKKEGWDKTRNALATTVRAWMMCGFLATATHDLTAAVEYHTRVMEVLKWGSRAWANIPLEDRGCIFEQTFIRGAKRLHIMAIHEALASKSGCQYTVDNLKELCIDLIADIHGNPPNPLDVSQVDPGFYLSFWVYPHAEALAILGWCHTQRGLKATNAEDFVAAFTKAAESYDEACSTFPEDDEKVATFLAANLESYAFSNRPWVDVKDLLVRIVSSAAKMKRFWINSPMSALRNRRFAQIDEFFSQSKKLEEEGRIKDSSIVKPDSFKGLDRFAAAGTIYV